MSNLELLRPPVRLWWNYLKITHFTLLLPNWSGLKPSLDYYKAKRWTLWHRQGNYITYNVQASDQTLTDGCVAYDMRSVLFSRAVVLVLWVANCRRSFAAMQFRRPSQIRVVNALQCKQKKKSIICMCGKASTGRSVMKRLFMDVCWGKLFQAARISMYVYWFNFSLP